MSTETEARERLISTRLTADGFLADSVVAAEGKVFVQGGGWNTMFSPNLPFRHPRIGIALVLRVPYQLADNMPKKFSLSLQDADGNLVPLGEAPPPPQGPGGKVLTLEGGFTVGRPLGVEPGADQNLPIAANIDGLTFEKAGSYVFRFSVDGEEVKSLPFRVAHVTQPVIGMRLG